MMISGQRQRQRWQLLRPRPRVRVSDKISYCCRLALVPFSGVGANILSHNLLRQKLARWQNSIAAADRRRRQHSHQSDPRTTSANSIFSTTFSKMWTLVLCLSWTANKARERDTHNEREFFLFSHLVLQQKNSSHDQYFSTTTAVVNLLSFSCCCVSFRSSGRCSTMIMKNDCTHPREKTKQQHVACNNNEPPNKRHTDKRTDEGKLAGKKVRNLPRLKSHMVRGARDLAPRTFNLVSLSRQVSWRSLLANNRTNRLSCVRSACRMLTGDGDCDETRATGSCAPRPPPRERRSAQRTEPDTNESRRTNSLAVLRRCESFPRLRELLLASRLSVAGAKGRANNADLLSARLLLTQVMRHDFIAN